MCGHGGCGTCVSECTPTDHGSPLWRTGMAEEVARDD